MCIYIYIYIFHQSKQKRNLFVLIVFDSGEENIFLQGYCSLLVIIRNSLMWLHTLLSYMNEFLNAFLRCKHCWHKPTSWCIVCAHAKRERERVGLFWDEVRDQVMKIWVSERERERERWAIWDEVRVQVMKIWVLWGTVKPANYGTVVIVFSKHELV